MTPVTTRVRLDRIASSTRNARLARDVIVGPRVVSEEGYVVAVRILEDKAKYNTVEDLSGRMVPLRGGDVLAGTLGERRALRGYAGIVPSGIEAGTVLDVLNLGGILGRCTSINPELGPPFRAEVLGAVLAFDDLGDRIGRPAHIRDHAVPPADALSASVPVVFVSGTCMNAGKTAAATEIIRGFARAGMRVAAAKLTGVALMRDSLSMLDAGAFEALTFNDAGAASTHAGMSAPVARGILNRLAEHEPEVIVAELGDGILGEYGVQDILADSGLMELGAAHVVAAPDPVGCWGAAEILRTRYGLTIAALTGPATDNDVGSDYIHRSLEIPAHNALRDPAGLVRAVLGALERWGARRPAGGVLP